MNWNSVMAAGVFYKKPKVKRKKVKSKKARPKLPNSSKFYRSAEWLELRYKTLVQYGRKCMCCGTEDAVFHVDHIKPRSKYPELQLDPNNLQILCEACNLGKSNKDETDFRLCKTSGKTSKMAKMV